MAGHNKWSKIHRKKEIRDQKKGGLFTKLGKNITLAAKKGGGDPETNFTLRLAIEKAKAANMPKDNIQRAIDRGLGKTEGSEMVELVLEGYAPAGVAVIVEAITDNRNRTVAELKNVFDKSGGSLAEPGSVMYQFERRGLVRLEGGELSENELLELIDLGVEEVKPEADGSQLLITTVEGLKKVVEYLSQKRGADRVTAKVGYLPKLTKVVQEQAKVKEFLSRLSAMDDVQEVYANLSS